MQATVRLGVWRQAWRLLAVTALSVPLWLYTGALLPKGGASHDWFLIGDPLVAIGCLVALLWRRRFPLAIGLLVAVASAVSALAAGAALLAVCSISTRRNPWEIGVVLATYVTAGQLAGDTYLNQGATVPVWVSILVPTLVAGLAAAVGVAVGARRDELRSWRERAESAEREQAARQEQARTLERNRIAREMHDVLAHRVSLVAMQAGVLSHVDGLSTAQVSELARGVADGSHQALEELRDVLGVLRAGPDSPEPPQPALERIPELIAGARTSGLRVSLTNAVREEPPAVVARTGYRIVQEALTNVSKHAPGARVEVTVDGSAGDGLRVSVCDSGATMAGEEPPSSGFGLLGLAERVSLAGGELQHHPVPGGGFVLRARLPWPARTGEGSA